MLTISFILAMVSVAEQFRNLRNALGSALGIFTLIRWIRTLIAKLTGRPPPADATALTPAAFQAYMHGGSVSTLPDGRPAPRPSRKPFIMFLLAVFGLPYLVGKLIKTLAESRDEVQRQQQLVASNGEAQQVLDPSKLDFCRVLYDYTPELQESNGIDLAVKKGDMVAVLSKSDPMGNASEWWRCRARDGRVGYLPGPYLEMIQRQRPGPQQQQQPPQQAAIAAANSSSSNSRTNTMTSANAKLDELRSLAAATAGKGKEEEKTKPELRSKMGDISPESFQKSAFYS